MWDMTSDDAKRPKRSQLVAETLFSPAPRYDVQSNGRGEWLAREIDAEPGDPCGVGDCMDAAILDLLEQLDGEIP